MSGDAPEQTAEPPRQGLLDTNILVLRRWIAPAELPDEMAISAVTLAELSAGPHQVRPNSEQDLYDEHEERARRTEALQRAESEFDPVPFDAEAARVYGRVTAAVVAAGRKPRRRIADLMIAATAIAEDLPLYTTNPGDYAGLEKLIRIVPVARPPLPHENKPDPRELAMARRLFEGVDRASARDRAEVSQRCLIPCSARYQTARVRKRRLAQATVRVSG